MSWYSLLKDARDPAVCPVESIRRSLLPLTTKKDAKEEKHPAWVFAQQDQSLPGHRTTALKVSLSLCQTVRSAASCTINWLGMENQDTGKVTSVFIRSFHILANSIANLEALKEMVPPTFTALNGEANPDEQSTNQGMITFLNYYSHVVGIAKSLKAGLAAAARDRLRGTLMDKSVAGLKVLYNDSWLHKLAPGPEMASRKEMFINLVIKNKSNHEKISTEVVNVQASIDALKPYAALFDGNHLIQEAKRAQDDAKAYVAATSIFAITIVNKMKADDPKNKFSQDDLQEAAADIVDLVKKNTPILTKEVLEEFWAILPERAPKPGAGVSGAGGAAAPSVGAPEAGGAPGAAGGTAGGGASA